MQELTYTEVGQVNGGVSLAAAAVGVAIAGGVVTSFCAGVAAGYAAMKDYMMEQQRQQLEAREQ